MIMKQMRIHECFLSLSLSEHYGVLIYILEKKGIKR
jgi:hypothetical protein